jgi:hypothetical protein
VGWVGGGAAAAAAVGSGGGGGGRCFFVGLCLVTDVVSAGEDTSWGVWSPMSCVWGGGGVD